MWACNLRATCCRCTKELDWQDRSIFYLLSKGTIGKSYSKPLSEMADKKGRFVHLIVPIFSHCYSYHRSLSQDYSHLPERGSGSSHVDFVNFPTEATVTFSLATQRSHGVRPGSPASCLNNGQTPLCCSSSGAR